MSTGYTQFQNEEVAVEGATVGSPPPQYEKPSAAPPPEYTVQQYPTHQQQPGVYTFQPPAYGPGQPPMQQNIVHVPTGPVPNDYFGFALFVTICCCLPLGIVALIKSSEVKNRSAMGDTHGAMLSSADAKRYSWIGCIGGGICWVIAIVFTAVYIGIIVAACNNDGYNC